jgi:acetolactate synthase I/II/III large subunit
MKKNGAMLTIYALEQIGVRKTFGIPGTYNSALYDQLFKSAHIEPIVVCNELSAAYMADAVSRTTNSIGTVVVVQGAGITNLISAIAQAYIDGIAILIISGSSKIIGKDYQMHSINLSRSLEGLVKNSYQITIGSDIIPTIYKAYEMAIGACPGPVYIDIPVSIQTEQTDLPLIPFHKTEHKSNINKSEESTGLQLFAENETTESKIESVVKLIAEAKSPGIYVGWGTINAFEEVKKLSEILTIPVCTTIQGISVFPNNHPLHTGIGFGKFAVPAAQNAFNNCDCLIAIGVKFSELATANYQMPVPENLIHIDINPDVFHKNYQAKIAIAGDSKTIINALIQTIIKKGISPKNNINELSTLIQNDKETYRRTWLLKSNEQLVSPGFFFNALRNYFQKEIILVSGNGSHRLLAAELFPVLEPREFICPTDSNTMGYGIPASIAAKLLSKQKTVIGLIGEAGLMVNGLELITAQYYKLGIILFVFRDWVSGQAQLHDKEKNAFMITPVHKSINIESFASSVHANYFIIKNDIDISGALTKSKELIKSGKNIVIEVHWDNSRKSAFEMGMTKPNLSRISLLDKLKILFKSNE